MQKENTVFRSAIRVLVAPTLLMMVPLVAVQVSDDWQWTVDDFLIAAILLYGTSLMFELWTRRSANLAHRAAIALALGTALFLVWSNGAVGIIGNENNAANVMYVGVLAVGFIGSLRARFQPQGMARAMFATAIAMVVVAVIALIAVEPVAPPPGGLSFAVKLLAVTGFFVSLFGASALLFRYVAQQKAAIQAG